jgi:sulfoxide reductase heme-binding subunit YedZ
MLTIPVCICLYITGISYHIVVLAPHSAGQMTNKLPTSPYITYLLWFLLALPFLWMTNAFRAGDLFYGEIIHESGEFSARLLMLTMAITPLRLMFSDAAWPNWLLHQRRYFGVAAFGYAALHTLVYLNHKGSAGLVVEEAVEFSMWTGWLALAIFLALAATSNDVSVRRLRRRWKKLHRWVYAAALLTFAHWIFVAFDFIPGLIHFLLLLLLESYRLWKRRAMKRLARSAGTG